MSAPNERGDVASVAAATGDEVGRIGGFGVNARRSAPFVSEIVGAGFSYPSEYVDNDTYFRRCRFAVAPDHAALVAETRMKTRRWCLPAEDTATMTRLAVQNLLEQHPGLEREIDVVVVASGTTMTMAHPSDRNNCAFADLSPLVLQQLGRSDGLGLDIKACYCSGFLRGVQVVDALLANPNYRVALLVAAEQGSRFALADTNRSSFCFIVSDAAGAVAFRRTEPRVKTGVVDYCGYSDVDKLSWVGIGPDAASIVMMGSRAGEATLEMLMKCARTLMGRNAMNRDSIDWLLPIQTHAGLIDELCRRLEWPRDKVLWHGDVNGFSGSASIPACLAEQIQKRTIVKGQSILSLAVGAGMNCAGALYYY
jgi:3-oxoacyl-[acyl-carrier-protein] synthase-3